MSWILDSFNSFLLVLTKLRERSFMEYLLFELTRTEDDDEVKVFFSREKSIEVIQRGGVRQRQEKESTG